MNGVKRQGGQIGRGLLSVCLWILALPLAGMLGFKALEVTYRYYDLTNFLRYALRSADIESDAEVRKKIAVRAKRSGVECLEQDIVVERRGNRVQVEVPYQHDLTVTVAGTRYIPLSIPMRAQSEREFEELNKR